MTNYNYYVYLLIDPRTRQPFYVGKGTGNRIAHHYTDARRTISNQSNPMKCAIINDILNDKLEVEECKVSSLTELAAYGKEKELIQQYGKIIDDTGILTNIQNGGNVPILRRQGIPVNQYDTTGKFIQKYKSFTEAARVNTLLKSRIRECCLSAPGTKITGGFQWRIYGNPPPPSYVRNRRSTKVYQYTTDGILICKFNSIREASIASGVKEPNISKARNNKLMSAGGFVWTSCITNDIQYKRSSNSARSIKEIDHAGDTIRQFSSIREAAKFLNIHETTIRKVCTGEFKQAKGCVFSYVWCGASVPSS